MSPAAWLLVLGWLPVVVGVRRAGFDPRARRRDGGREDSRARRRDGGREDSRAAPGAALRRFDVILLLLTWLAGAGVTALALRDQTRAPNGLRLTAGLVLFLASVATWAAVRRVHGLDYAQLPRAPLGLVTRGPYRVVRHPLYLATGAAGLGQAIAGGALSTFTAWGALVLLLVVRAAREERLLHATFGGAWEAYARAVPGWLPTWKR
jgi:protein-S-isoprenylcysteine O-methyltransferase Ste14